MRLAIACAVFACGTATAQTTVVYEADTSDFVNPERGFYRYSETRASNHTPLIESELEDNRELQTPFGANYSVRSSLVSSCDLCQAFREETKDIPIGFCSLFWLVNMLFAKWGRILNFPKRRVAHNLKRGLYSRVNEMTALDYLMGTEGLWGSNTAEMISTCARTSKGYMPGLVRKPETALRFWRLGTFGAFVYFTPEKLRLALEGEW